MDDNSVTASCSLEENLEGYTSLHDIFQALSEVPLHDAMHMATTSPPQNIRQLTKGHQFIEEPKSKHVDGVKGKSKEKRLLQAVQNEPPCDEHHHDSSKRLSQRRYNEHKRRERINTKMRAIRALLPNCDKRDHASILDHAIKHIKSLKLQVDMMSKSVGQGQVQNPYTPQMMMRPTMVPRTGYGPWDTQMPSSGYPFLPQVQVQAQAPFTQIYCPIQYIPTTIATPPTPTVLSFVPSMPQFNHQPYSFIEPPHY